MGLQRLTIDNVLSYSINIQSVYIEVNCEWRVEKIHGEFQHFVE